MNQNTTQIAVKGYKAESVGASIGCRKEILAES